MQFLLLVYTDAERIAALPEGEFDATMKGCFEHADDLKRAGKLLQSQQLEDAATARSVRIRNGKTQVMDGPFAETKELLGGFNLIEADDIDEAIRIAESLPWAAMGCIEVRPVRNMALVRERVGAPA